MRGSGGSEKLIAPVILFFHQYNNLQRDIKSVIDIGRPTWNQYNINDYEIWAQPYSRDSR